ncbi:hypothetical protein, partial [Pseudomonas aeruginosa]
DRTLLWQYYSIPNWYLNTHRLAYRNRFAFVATPPNPLGQRAWWQKKQETSRLSCIIYTKDAANDL